MYIFDHEQVRKLLDERGWSQFDFALRTTWVEVSSGKRHMIRPEYISKYLAGKHQPGTSHLRRMADVLEVSTDSLLVRDPGFAPLQLPS